MEKALSRLSIIFGVLISLAVLVGVYVVLVFMGFLLADVPGLGFLFANNQVYLLASAFGIALGCSYFYFLVLGYPPDQLRSRHAVAGIALLLLFSVQAILTHYDQGRVLATYTQLWQAYKARDWETAYGLTTPGYRSSHSVEDLRRDLYNEPTYGGYGPARSIFAVDFVGRPENLVTRKQAFVIPDASINFWNGSNCCVAIEFEKIEGVYYYTGDKYFYYPD